MTFERFGRAFRWQPRSPLGVFLMWALGLPVLGSIVILLLRGEIEAGSVGSLAILGVVLGA